MKYCDKCKVEVRGSQEFCPLCQNELQVKETSDSEDVYPNQVEKRFDNHMLLKVFGFIGLSASILAVFFNIILHSKSLWSLIVVVVMACLWLSLAIAIRKHKDILKYLWQQMVIITLLTICIDALTGHHGWSISFVLPIILTVAMIVMYLLSKILHLQVGDYMIYLLLDAFFGVIPLVLVNTHKLISDIPSLICILTSIISVVALVIFEGKSIMSELNRRLHI